MKAIRVTGFGDPQVLQYQNVGVPTPGANQVLIQVHAAGVNPVDTYIRSGQYAHTPALPYTPGQDAAGMVAAVGDDVVGIAVGDCVYTSGTVTGSYAQYAVCNTPQVYPLPATASYVQGAALGTPYATAWRALFQRGRACAGESVLIHGATGGVGWAATQMATAAGLRVYATGGTDAGCDNLLELSGRIDVFNHHSSDYLDRIHARSGGLDLVIEMLANANLDHDLDVLAPGGRIVVVGNRGQVRINPRKLMQKESAILGVMLSAATEAENTSIHAGIEIGITNANLTPAIDQTITLKDAAKAHQLIEDKSYHGKIVLLTHEAA